MTWLKVGARVRFIPHQFTGTVRAIRNGEVFVTWDDGLNANCPIAPEHLRPARTLRNGCYLPPAFHHARLRRERFAADAGWMPSIARMLAQPLAHNELVRAGLVSTHVDKRARKA